MNPKKFYLVQDGHILQDFDTDPRRLIKDLDKGVEEQMKERDRWIRRLRKKQLKEIELTRLIVQYREKNRELKEELMFAGVRPTRAKRVFNQLKKLFNFS